MADPVVAPQHPPVAVPPRPVSRRGLWALPLLLSLAFVVAVLTWLRAAHSSDAEQQRLEMITDALSLESQMSGRIEREALLLKELATVLERGGTTPQAFANLPEVQLGLRRFWISITWLDANHRLVAQLPLTAAGGAGLGVPAVSSVGTSSHLGAPLATGGSLVARYSPPDMLRQSVPWWLARKYDVRFVDSFGNVMASNHRGPRPGRPADLPHQHVADLERHLPGTDRARSRAALVPEPVAAAGGRLRAADRPHHADAAQADAGRVAR